MNTFQLSCFLTVAETLNFARAAERLNITQPAVTHQIRALETELNVKLFKRTTRSVSLTYEGSVFIGDAKAMLGISIRAKKRFDTPPAHEIRLFSIGCHSYSHVFLLPDMLKELSRRYPSIHPRLQVVPFLHLFRLLEEEDVDAIIGFREPATRGESLPGLPGTGLDAGKRQTKKQPGTYKELWNVPIVCICSRDNPLSQMSSVRVHDLKEERLVLNDPSKSPASIAKLQGRLMESHSPSELYFCDSPESAMALVQAGFGIAVLPNLHIPPDVKLSCIPVEDMDPISFGIYYKTLKGNPILKDMIQIMKSSPLPKSPVFG